MSISVFFSFILVWLSSTSGSISQLKLPSVECPLYFRYVALEDDGYMGKITLADVPFRALTLEVTFSQSKPYTKPFKGSLAFEANLLRLQKIFENGDPVTLNVTFPSKTEVPKLIRIRMNDEVICSANVPSQHEIEYTLRRHFTPTEGTHRSPKEIIGITPSTTSTMTPIIWPIDSRQCGINTLNATQAALNDFKAEAGWFPWEAMISIRCYTSDTYLTAGVLISSRTVVTSHAIFQICDVVFDEVIVYLGALGQNKSDWGQSTTIRHIKARHFDESLDQKSSITLLQLDEPVSFSSTVFPICLPQESDNVNIVGRIGYMATYTHPSIWNPSGAGMLEMEFLNQTECGESDEASPLIFARDRTCSGINRPRLGHGLISYRNGRWILRGICFACKTKNNECEMPLIVICSNIAKSISWIKDNMWWT